MNHKLRDYRFWTSSVSLIVLIVQHLKPEFKIGEYQPILDAVFFFLIQNGILHDYGTNKGENGNVSN